MTTISEGSAPTETETATENPYIGLRPFDNTPEDIARFFGRREQTAELLASLHRTKFLAVVGSSGCGKSSLIRAGLTPALRGGFLVESRDTWHFAKMKPGDQPLRNFANGLVEAYGGEPDGAETEALLEDIALNHTEAVVQFLSKKLDARDNLLLLVDQFEEIFAFRGVDRDDAEDRGAEGPQRSDRSRGDDHDRRREEAATFVDLLISLRQRKDLHAYTVLTMRTDFLGDCDLFYGLPEAMNEGRYLVPRLTRKQLRAVVTGPAHASGTEIAARLVDLLLNELGARMDRLPVLQHALFRMWKLWHQAGGHGQIDIADFKRAGTLEHALRDDAEEALSECRPVEVERLFRCLTDTDESYRRIRRPARLSVLVKATGLERATILHILKRFRADGRNFVYFSGGGEDPRVDISHESLIRRWPKLAMWVDEERVSRDRFLDLVGETRALAAGEGSLLVQPKLGIAQEWWENEAPNAAWANRYVDRADDLETVERFLEASQAAHEQLQQELEDRRRNRRNWLIAVAVGAAIFSAGLLVALLFAKAATAKAKTAEVEAQRERIRAQALEIVANTEKAIAQRNYLDAAAHLVELEKLEKVDAQDVDAQDVIEDAAKAAKVIVSRGQRFTFDLDEPARLAMVVNGTHPFQLDPPIAPPVCIVVDEAGELVRKGLPAHVHAPDPPESFEAGGLGIWAIHGFPVAPVEDEDQPRLHGMTAAAYGPDGRVATASRGSDDLLTLWSLEGARLRGPREVELPGPASSVQFSDDGRWLVATTASNELQLFALAPPQAADSGPLRRVSVAPPSDLVENHPGAVIEAQFSEPGSTGPASELRLLTASWDGWARVFQLPADQDDTSIVHVGSQRLDTTQGLLCAALSPDGARVVSGHEDGTVRVWEPGRGDLGRIELRGHTGPVVYVGFFDSGGVIVTSSDDATTRFWELASKESDAKWQELLSARLDAKVVSPGQQHRGWLVTQHRIVTEAEDSDEDSEQQELRVWRPRARGAVESEFPQRVSAEQAELAKPRKGPLEAGWWMTSVRMAYPEIFTAHHANSDEDGALAAGESEAR